MLDADGATKVNDLEKLENQVCIIHHFTLETFFLFFCFWIRFYTRETWKSGLCHPWFYTDLMPTRSLLLPERSLSLEIQQLAIRVLGYLISQWLHLVLGLILRRKLWLQFSLLMLPTLFVLYFVSLASLFYILLCWTISLICHRGNGTVTIWWRVSILWSSWLRVLEFVTHRYFCLIFWWLIDLQLVLV